MRGGEGNLKERRSFFQMVFGTGKQKPQNYTQVQMLNSSPNFYDFSGDGYDSDVVRATVDAFARNVGKLKPRHLRKRNGKVETIPSSNIEWLLQTRPNRFMNAYIFYYRLATQFLMHNNVFVWIRRDEKNQIEGFYPLASSGVELLNNNGEMAVRFRFYNGQTYQAPYNDIIHLRRFYFDNDMYGETNKTALNPILNMISVANQGIGNAVKTSALLRGILKFTGMIKPEDMKKQTDNFAKDYLTAANSGGVAAVDSKADYIELKNDPKMIDDRLMNAMGDKVYSYFGSNKKIVQSDFSEEEWAAYYESMIETFAVQAGLEFTVKVFSDRSMGHGNEIMFEANRLQYASNDTKIKIIETLVDRGLMNKNEGREIFNMGPIPDGDTYIVSLNYVQADKANEYQLGEKGASQTKLSSDDGSGDDGADKTISDITAVDELTDVAEDVDGTISQISLNGSQIQSLLSIVQSVRDGVLDYDSAIELIVAAFPFDKDKAKKILGEKASGESKPAPKGGEDEDADEPNEE